MKMLFIIIVVISFSVACSRLDNTAEQNINHESIQGIEKVIEEKNISDNISNQLKDDMPIDNEKNVVDIIHEKMKSIDFTIKESPIVINEALDILYREAYLNILKSKIPTTNYKGDKEYFRDLYKMELTFEEIEKFSDSFSFYYNDLDGDGQPELGIKSTGETYILKYEIEKDEFQVLYSMSTMYITILGTGQLWYHDGLHAGLIRDRYIILNDDNEWEEVFRLEKGIDLTSFYCISIDKYQNIDVGEENWNEITKPFFDVTKNAIPSMSLEEVFGELLEDGECQKN